jgi:hypothetical protein
MWCVDVIYLITIIWRVVPRSATQHEYHVWFDVLKKNRKHCFRVLPLFSLGTPLALTVSYE